MDDIIARIGERLDALEAKPSSPAAARELLTRLDAKIHEAQERGYGMREIVGLIVGYEGRADHEPSSAGAQEARSEQSRDDALSKQVVAPGNSPIPEPPITVARNAALFGREPTRRKRLFTITAATHARVWDTPEISPIVRPPLRSSKRKTDYGAIFGWRQAILMIILLYALFLIGFGSLKALNAASFSILTAGVIMGWLGLAATRVAQPNRKTDKSATLRARILS